MNAWNRDGVLLVKPKLLERPSDNYSGFQLTGDTVVGKLGVTILNNTLLMMDSFDSCFPFEKYLGKKLFLSLCCGIQSLVVFTIGKNVLVVKGQIFLGLLNNGGQQWRNGGQC